MRIKNIFILSLSLFSFSPGGGAYAQQGVVEQNQVIGHIRERNSDRELIYTRSDSSITFTLKQGESEQELKKLDLALAGTDLALSVDGEHYRFEFLHEMKNASGKAYEWCWVSGEVPIALGGDPLEVVPAISGLIPFAPISLALCAVVPGVPYLVGVLAAPIDGAITAEHALFDSDVVAARKFSKLMRGQDTQASPKVFAELLKKISEL